MARSKTEVDDDKEVVVRTDEGKWPTGVSGNPSGFSKQKRREFKEFQSLMRSKSPKAVAALDKILDDPMTDPSTRLKAIGLVLDRAWGKAIQPVASEVDPEGDERPGPVTETQLIDGARRIMAVFAKAIDARFPGQRLGGQPMTLLEARELIEGQPTEAQLEAIKARRWWDRDRQALPAKAGPLSLNEFRQATAAALRANATDAVVVKQEPGDE